MNQNGSIDDMRDEFGDSDDNDEFNTLQSILSWDDGEEAEQNNGSVAGHLASFRSQGGTSTALPPDMDQFFMNKDGASQLSFNTGNYSNSGDMFANTLSDGLMQQQQQRQQHQSNTLQQQQNVNLIQPPQQQQQQQQQQMSNQSGNLALPLPIPMTIASRCTQPEGSRHTNSSSQPPSFQVPQNSGQNAVLAQLLAQLQQSANNQGQQQQATNMQPRLQQQSQQQQQQQPLVNQPQQQPQQQAPQFQFDPQALMRQLQYAQLQQQLQAAQNNNNLPQMHAQQSNQQIQQETPLQQHMQMPMAPQPTALPPPPPQQQQQPTMQNAIRRQLQQHFQQAQAAVNAPVQQQVQQQVKSPVQPQVQQQELTARNRNNAMMPPSRSIAVKPSTGKKSAPVPKVQHKASKSSAPFQKNSSGSGTVSASDTDVDTYRQVNVSKKLSAKEKPNLDLIDTSNMTPQQRAKVNRDRNREHARNTRMRKKAYLEKLKSTVDDLCRERDTLVSERAGAANLLVEMHETRTEVLMSFFALRTTNEKRRKLWASIIDECCFACVMPVTPYRSFPASEVQVSKCMRTVMGIDGIMADTASLHALFDSLVDRAKYPFERITFRYTLVTEEAVVAGNQMMARWVMTTTNAVQLGSNMEVSKQGMLCCKFNSAHKIIGLEIMFDVMAFMLQLKQAAGSEAFTVIPNTVQTCQKSFDKPMVVTLADPPYTIIQVNNSWENMTGYTADEVVGKLSCSILQPPDMDRKAVTELMQEVRFKRAASAMLVNRTKSGMLFNNFLVVYPLSTDSRITYYLGLTTYTRRVTSMLSTAQNMIGQESYGSVAPAPSAGSHDMAMPPMLFDQQGQMPPPVLQLQQNPAPTLSQHQQQQQQQ